MARAAKHLRIVPDVDAVFREADARHRNAEAAARKALAELEAAAADVGEKRGYRMSLKPHQARELLGRGA